ncbi:beta-N-acetylhexosaminidase [Pseudomonas sp. HK3]|jgi:beta-N-acetylhexosaminidase
MQVTFITDVQSSALSDEERQWLKHRFLGGIILFTRHFQSRDQLAALVKEIKTINPRLLITVDHEGGRVQRFREGFTHVPAMGRIGALYSHDPDKAVALAKSAAIVLAYELQEVGIDLTYAPVLDINYDRNNVIGDRGFCADKNVIKILAASFMSGLKEMDFAVVAKHFPGHGWVNLDSHVACPIDERSFTEIEQQDLEPFKQLLPAIDWMMPAHVVYESVDSEPAGFSQVWLKDILRKKMGFEGRIVSDDLSMAGAAVKGDYQQRALAAVNAGCDILLACNHAEASIEILKGLEALSVEPFSLEAYKPIASLNENKQAYMHALALLAELD